MGLQLAYLPRVEPGDPHPMLLPQAAAVFGGLELGQGPVEIKTAVPAQQVPGARGFEQGLPADVGLREERGEDCGDPLDLGVAPARRKARSQGARRAGTAIGSPEPRRV